MGKIKNFMNKPITWGAVVKMELVSLGLAGASMIGFWVYEKVTEAKYYKERYYKECLGIGNDDSEEDVMNQETES